MNCCGDVGGGGASGGGGIASGVATGASQQPHRRTFCVVLAWRRSKGVQGVHEAESARLQCSSVTCTTKTSGAARTQGRGAANAATGRKPGPAAGRQGGRATARRTNADDNTRGDGGGSKDEGAARTTGAPKRWALAKVQHDNTARRTVGGATAPLSRARARRHGGQAFTRDVGSSGNCDADFLGARLMML